MNTSSSESSTDTTDRREDAWPMTVGNASEVPTDSRGFYTVDGVNITVFNVDGELYAIENSCPHMGAPLGEGKLLRTAAAGTNPVSRFQEFDPKRKGSQVSAPSTNSPTRLTIGCPHHGWEFDLTDGTPVFPAKQGVRTYPVRVEDGLIKLDLPVEPDRPSISG